MKKVSRFSRRVACFFTSWRQRYRNYVSQCLTSGFIPTSCRPLQAVARVIARIWLFIQVGRISVLGANNLKTPGRIIFCPNHSSMFDAIIIYAIMRRWPRYMTAYEEMQGLGGLKAIAMGAFGCFPVDRAHGQTVLDPAIAVLKSGQPLVIFPEGKISETGKYLPFKRGPAFIANSAYEQLGMKESVGFVPIHICYHKRDVATACGPFFKMGLKWRHGATVTVGQPIYLNELSSRNSDDIMAIVSNTIKKLAYCPAEDFELPSP